MFMRTLQNQLRMPVPKVEPHDEDSGKEASTVPAQEVIDFLNVMKPASCVIDAMVINATELHSSILDLAVSHAEMSDFKISIPAAATLRKSMSNISELINSNATIGEEISTDMRESILEGSKVETEVIEGCEENAVDTKSSKILDNIAHKFEDPKGENKEKHLSRTSHHAASKTCDPGALGPPIIYLTDDEDEVETKPRSIVQEPFAVKTEVKPAKSYGDKICASGSISHDSPNIHYFGNKVYTERQLGILKSPCLVPKEDMSSTNDVIMATTPVRDTPRWSATTIGTFTVQCNLCGKWRLIPTKEQYQAIGERITERPWTCVEARFWRENASCRDPSDIAENEPSILWAIDKHNIPKPPSGFHRKVVLRGELSTNFADVYYKTPCGQTLRSMNDVDRFLKSQPKYVELGVSISQFCFSTPRPGPGIQKRNKPSLESKYFKKQSVSTNTTPNFPSTFPQPLAVLDPTGNQRPVPLPDSCPVHLRNGNPSVSNSSVHSNPICPSAGATPAHLFHIGPPSSQWMIYQSDTNGVHHQFEELPLSSLLPRKLSTLPSFPMGGEESPFPIFDSSQISKKM